MTSPSKAQARMVTADQPEAVLHGMLPGSHERHGGAECRCGKPWDRWNETCGAAPTSPATPAVGVEVTRD